MTRVAAVVAAVVLATPCLADLGSSTNYWAAPGVLNSNSVTTLFQCSLNPKRSSQAEIFGVEVFDENGSLLASRSMSLAPGATGMTSLQHLNWLPGENTDMGLGAASVRGSARFGSKDMICTAYIVAPGASPGSMNALPVLAQAKQRGQ